MEKPIQNRFSERKAGTRVGESHAPGKGEGDLHHGKDEFLVFDPLAPEDDHETQSHEDDRDDESQPPEQRNAPNAPGNGRIGRDAVDEPREGVALVGNGRPGLQVRVEVFAPLVLGRRKQVGRHERGDEGGAHAVGRQPRSRHAHGQGNDELMGRQGPVSIPPGEDHVEKYEIRKGQKQRADVKMIRAQLRRGHGVLGNRGRSGRSGRRSPVPGGWIAA